MGDVYQTVRTELKAQNREAMCDVPAETVAREEPGAGPALRRNSVRANPRRYPAETKAAARGEARQITFDSHISDQEWRDQYARNCADTRPCWLIKLRDHDPIVGGVLGWGDTEDEAIADAEVERDEVVSVTRKAE